MPARLSTPRIVFPSLVTLLCLSVSSASADPARWEPDIAKFEQLDRENPPKPGSILFVGSSSIRLWDTDRFFPGMAIVNRGFGGSELEDSIAFLNRIVLPHRPRIVVLYAGDNDIAQGKTAQRVYDDFIQFASLIHAELPQTRIIWLPIKPSMKRWEMAGEMALANSMVKAAADRDPRILYADLWSPMLGEDGKPRPELFVEDQLHLSETGYTLWSERLKPVIDQADKDFKTALND